MDNKQQLMRQAIAAAMSNVKNNSGGPFGAVIVKNGQIIAYGKNAVTTTNDPTAHAEVVAIREACKILGSFQLTGCELYTSCEPCPMCLGAIYWSRPARLFFANTKKDAAEIHFDDHFIYQELEMPFQNRKLFTKQLLREEALEAFQLWSSSINKIEY